MIDVADEAAEDDVAKETRVEAPEGDRRTGYYIAGHDWPAISSTISLSKIYGALSLISDDSVGAALRDVAEPTAPTPSG
jgi:hypothetical protein